MSPAVLRRLLYGFLALTLNVHAAPTAGDVPPDVVGMRLDGTPVRVSDYAGKAVVLSFWATWCGYCLKELPVLDSIQTVSTKGSIQVIGVNTETRMVFRDASRVLAKSAIQLAYDPGNLAQKAYGVDGIPHMVIIGKDGKIVRIYRGYAETELPQIVADINQATGATAAAK